MWKDLAVMEAHIQQPLAMVLEQAELVNHGRSGALSDEVLIPAAEVALAWENFDGRTVPPEANTQVWQALGALQAHQALVGQEPGRQEAQALALLYFTRAGEEGGPGPLLRRRAALTVDGDWLNQIADGQDRDRLLPCLRSRLRQATDTHDASVLCDVRIDVLTLAVVECAVLESPGCDDDPPRPDLEAWQALGWLHWIRSNVTCGPPQAADTWDEVLGDFYFASIFPDHPGLVPDQLRAVVEADPRYLTLQGMQRTGWGLLRRHGQQPPHFEALYLGLHLLRTAAARSADRTGDADGDLQAALAEAWLGRFKRSGEPAHLDRAIDAAERSAHDGPGELYNRISQTDLLRYAHRIRFERDHDERDIDQAIESARGVCALTTDATAALGLATVLMLRHEHVGDPGSRDEAERVLRRALAGMAEDHEFRPRLLNSLGNALRMRHVLSADEDALDEARNAYEEAMRLLPKGDDPRWWMYQENARQALALKIGWTDTLMAEGMAYFAYSESSGDLQALRSAADALRQAVKSTAPDHPKLVNCYTALCFTLRRLGERMSDPEIMSEAVQAGRKAVAASPPGGPHYASALSDLGVALRALSAMVGDPALFDEGLKCARQAAEQVPADYPDPGMFFSNLSNALMRRGAWTGSLSLLDEAVAHARKAVAVTPEGHESRHVYLCNLGTALMRVYNWTLDSAAITAAADAYKRAYADAPSHDYRRGRYQANLGRLYEQRFNELGQPGDLEAAIEALTAAVDATPADHPALAGRLASLSSAHRTLDRLQGDPPSPAALALARRAVAAARPENPYLVTCLTELADALLDIYKARPDVPVLSEAIKLARRALAAATAREERAQAMLVLASALALLADFPGSESKARAEALDLFQGATKEPAPAAAHISAVRQWADLCARVGDWPHVLDAVEVGLQLVPLLVSRRLGRRDQYEAAARLQGLAGVGAAAALNLDRPKRAVELLEMGRGTVLARSLESGTDLDALREHSHELADEFMFLAQELDMAATPDPAPDGPEDTSEHRKQLAAAFDRLLDRIRHIAGFAHFLAPMPFTELASAADDGPVVIVNVSPYRCDALAIIGGDRPDVVPIELRGVTLGSVIEQANEVVIAADSALADSLSEREAAQVQMRQVLSWLWNHVAEPVLHRLGIEDHGERRLWWCPVGPMAYLPLHAASGGAAKGASVPDRVISSYTSTLRALQHARKVAQQPSISSPADDMLAVAMPHTPGASPLPGAQAEVDALRALVPGAQCLAGPQATQEAVLAAMRSHRIAHFACHGVSDPENPAESRLLLHDHITAPLTVTRVSAQRLARADLAYLSACETARSLPRLADEALHITGAFQLAGYRSVIGTLWPIEDDIAATIARRIYGNLTCGGTRPVQAASAALALHHAVQQVRQASPEWPTAWGGHIHVGL